MQSILLIPLSCFPTSKNGGEVAVVLYKLPSNAKVCKPQQMQVGTWTPKVTTNNGAQKLTAVLAGTVGEVCRHKPRGRLLRARRQQLQHGMSTACVRRLGRRAGMARVPGVRYSDDQPVVNAMGHTRQDKIGTHGGGDGPWQGVPSTPKQKRQSAYALHTRVQESTIPNAGLGLFMLERARKKERVAVYSGTLLTKEEAAASNSMYIIEVNKNQQFLDGQDIAHAAGRYINYAPYSESNAVMGAGKSPSWDDVKKRWWVSIFARKGIPAGEEIKMPYGSAYKGLRENANKKVKKAFAMRSSAQDSGSGGGSQTNDKQWKHACARMMKHMTALSQRL